jgi:hypothetical protein
MVGIVLHGMEFRSRLAGWVTLPNPFDNCQHSIALCGGGAQIAQATSLYQYTEI